MARSSKQYRAPTRVRRPNHLLVIFNTARLRSTSARVRRLARTVLRVYVHCLFLLLAVRSCVQVIEHTAVAVKTLTIDPNESNVSLASDQSPDECPLTEVINDCLSCLFGKWAWHGPGHCDMDCPQVAVDASDGYLNTCLMEVPLQDTLQNQTVKGPVGPEETSGQCQLPLPVASYSTAFKTMFHGITFPIDFILWHTTLVTFNTFIHISLILYEFGPPLWTMNRETWRKLRKASSLSGKRGISHCRKTWIFLCVYLCTLSTHCLCMARLKRFKHQALSKQICRQLIRIPSLGLGRGVRCGQNIHGRLVTSFTVQKSFVKHIRVRPRCPVLLSRVAHHSKSVTKAVTVRSCVFLGLLLLLAGDIESNPGPGKGKEREASAKDVLDLFREQFLEYVDAQAVVHELKHHGIVPQKCQERVAKSDGYRQRNEILHDCLKSTCTWQALIEACDIIIALAGKGGEESNPNMKKVGEDMKMKLRKVKGEGGGGGEGLSGGSESEGEKEFQHFSDELRDEYQKITVVYAPNKQDQEMEFINLALSRFVPKFEDDHRKFVLSMTEGVDSAFRELQDKVEYGSIMSLVKKHRLVVISGAPGTGKTTLAKKLCKDVSRDLASHGYKLMMKVELRDLVPLVQDPSSFELKQMMNLFESVGEMERVVERMKATSGADTLLILDGYDELPPDLRHSSFFVNLLSPHSLRSPLRKTHIILTSRSIVMSEIHHHFRSAQVPLVNIEVLGFTNEQIQHFIGQYFEGEGKSELSAKLSAKLDALPHIKGLCSIPVVLSIISHVFLSRKDLPPTLTQLYDEFVCETLSSMFPGLQSTLELPVQDHDFLKLCEIAYECTKKQKLIFTTSDLMGLQDKYSNRETGCGLLTARPVNKLRSIVAESFYFIHFTVQEFLTAAHIAWLKPADQHAFWDEHLGQLHLAQTWRFYCGITKMAHYDLLQSSKVRGMKGFDELLMQSFFETQDRNLVGRLMSSVMGENVKLDLKTAYDSIAFGFCLEQHISLQHLKVQLPSEVVAEVQYLLKPCLCCWQLQTLAIHGGGSPEDWRQVGDIFDRIRNCEGHFGKVCLGGPPLNVAVKLLCLQQVREVKCFRIRCEAMDLGVLKEMEKAIEENKTLEMLTLRDDDFDKSSVTLPKEFCRSVLIGIGRNTSLSEVDLNFFSFTWDCPIDVPADNNRSVEHVTLRNVPVDVLPRLFLWFSQVKHFECHRIRPPQERQETDEDVMFTEVEQTLFGMGRLKKLVLGSAHSWPTSLVVKFGVSVLKRISGNKHPAHFVLYDQEITSPPLHHIHSIFDMLPTDMQRHFIIEEYTDEFETDVNSSKRTFPCISRSASGTQDIPGPSWWTSPPPPGRRRGQQWMKEGTRPAKRNRAYNSTSDDDGDDRGSRCDSTTDGSKDGSSPSISPPSLEAVAKLPSTVTNEFQLALMTTNLHPIKMMNFFPILCQHHKNVVTTLEAIAFKKASEINGIMSLKAYYICYILRTFISKGKETYVRKCLTQQVPEGVYKERDAYLRQFLKEYPHKQNSAWKQMVATASRVPLGGPPSVLSMLQSAVRGQAGFGEGEEEECATCGSVNTDLKKCLGCKQVRYCNVECQKMAWEQGSHKKMCKLYRKKHANVDDGQDSATPKASGN